MRTTKLSWQRGRTVRDRALKGGRRGHRFQTKTCDQSATSLGLYYGLLISNPNMMFIQATVTETSLSEIDVNAWALLAFIAGDVVMPTPEEMDRRNVADILLQMDLPHLRDTFDPYYTEALVEFCWKHGDHWMCHGNERHHAMRIEVEEFGLRKQARIMRETGYPVDIGSFEELNEKATQICRNNGAVVMGRDSVEEGGRETYRDGDVSTVRSIFTGIQAAPLRKLWLDLDESEYDYLLIRGGLFTRTHPFCLHGPNISVHFYYFLTSINTAAVCIYLRQLHSLHVLMYGLDHPGSDVMLLILPPSLCF